MKVNSFFGGLAAIRFLTPSSRALSVERSGVAELSTDTSSPSRIGRKRVATSPRCKVEFVKGDRGSHYRVDRSKALWKSS